MARGSEKECLCELVDYAERLPFHIHGVHRKNLIDDCGRQKDIIEHWHPELEIVYTYAGHAAHYIDGRVHTATPDSLFVINPESIHKVISDIDLPESVDLVAVVLMVNQGFLKSILPNLSEMYFQTEVGEHLPELRQIMESLEPYADNQRSIEQYQEWMLIGKMYELMSILCRMALRPREELLPINSARNLERLRGVMIYVKENFREPIRQSEVAERFHFTKEYFSRFFRSNTGMTFKEFLTRVRLREARKDIVSTRKSMLEVALDNGFTDSRSLINAFKAIYGMTPYQYRKLHMQS